MAVSMDFIDHIIDQLRVFGPVAVRRMFSGAGLFRNGRMFGLVAGDALYFKVGDGNRAAFDAAGARPFTYRRNGAEAAIGSFRAVPADVLDDPDLLADWARGASAAAMSAAAPQPNARRANRIAKRVRNARNLP